MTSDDTFQAIVRIPGEFYAHYDGDLDGGTITKLVFAPHGSNAGYFGPAAELWEYVDEDDDAPGLDVERTDGSFWQAMQQALAKHTVFDNMEDNDDDSTVDIFAVPIDWEE